MAREGRSGLVRAACDYTHNRQGFYHKWAGYEDTCAGGRSEESNSNALAGKSGGPR